MKKIDSRKIVIIGLLTALAVVLKMVVIYVFNNNRIVFHNIPIIIVSACYGPLFGVISAIVTDVLSIVVTSGWNPLFTIPQIFWGLIPGLIAIILKRKNKNNKLNRRNIILIEIFSYLLVSITNTIVMAFVYSPEVALGIISREKDLIIGFEIFKLDFSINLGRTYYLGILMKLIIMIIKIPIDILILDSLFKRFSDKLDIEYA